MKFGVREICDVVLKAKNRQKIGDKIFYKNEPVLYFDSLKTSTLEGASTTVYAQGGRGNSRLVAWEGERTITFTMEDALISEMGFTILSGANLIESNKKNTNINNFSFSGALTIEDLYEFIEKEKEALENLKNNYPEFYFDEKLFYFSDKSLNDDFLFNNCKLFLFRVDSDNNFETFVLNPKLIKTNIQEEGKEINIYGFSIEEIENIMKTSQYSSCFIRLQENNPNIETEEIHCIKKISNKNCKIDYAFQNYDIISFYDNNSLFISNDFLSLYIINLKTGENYKCYPFFNFIQNNLSSEYDRYGNFIPNTEFGIGNEILIPIEVADLLRNNQGEFILDYYEIKQTKAKRIEISADKFGGNYYLEASTLFRTQDGVDMPAEFVIPNCKIQSNFTFNMASSGDPSTFTFTMDAFPDYTRFDKSKKVLAAIQIITDDKVDDLKRESTNHSF